MIGGALHPILHNLDLKLIPIPHQHPIHQPTKINLLPIFLLPNLLVTLMMDARVKGYLAVPELVIWCPFCGIVLQGGGLCAGLFEG